MLRPKTILLLYLKTLEKNNYDISYLFVKSNQKFKQALNEDIWDVILSEQKLPKFSALAALEILRKSKLNVPLIVISSKKDNDIIIEHIKNGASNFIHKKNINELPKIIQREINTIKLKSQDKSEKDKVHQLNRGHFQTLFENSPTPFWEEEFSELDKYLNKLKEKGINDFRKYFDDKPAELTKCISKIKIVDVNKASLKLYNAKTKDDLIKNVNKIFTENSYNVFKEELIAISKGKREFESEAEVKTLTGEIKFILLQLKIDKYNKGQKRALLTTVDITDSKKIEDSLKTYTSRLEQAEKDAEFGSWEFDVPSKKGWWSKQMYVMLGFDESKGIPTYDDYLNHIHPDDRELVLNALKSMEKGEQPINAIFRTNPKLGSMRYLAPTYSTVRDEKGNALKFTGTSHDVTRSKINEEALQRLNRELRAISDCNQTLLRVKNEQTLLNEICRIICDEADYLFAWVGYAINDEFKTIKPMAFAGLEEGYLKDAKLSWSDKIKYGQGPAGTCVRTGEIIYSQNFSTDTKMKTWRKAALQRGYNSGIVFPLKDENKNTFGVLAVYSSEIDLITPNEIRLMEELAGDLAYGIINLRSQAERKKAEEVIKESNKQLIKVQKLAQLGFLDWDLNTNNIFLSDEIYNIYGLNRGSNYSEPDFVAKVVHPDDIAYVQKNLESALRDIKKYNIDHRIIRPDGKTRWVNAQADLIKDDSGKPVKLLGTVLDITERMEANIALRESEERFASIFKLSPMGIAIFRASDGKIVEVNDYFVERTGYTREEIINHTALELNLYANPEEREQNLKELFENNSIENQEYKIRRKNGEIGYGLSSTTTIKLGGEMHFISMVVDITNHKLAEEALRLSEEKFRLIAKNTADTISILDLNLKQTYVSDSVERLRGYTPEEALKQSLDLVLTPDSLKKATNILAEQLHLEKSGQVDPQNIVFLELEEYRKDGSTVWVEVSALFLRDENLNPAGILTVTRDITERRKNEELLRESERRFKELANLLPQTIFETDINGKLTFANETALITYGYSHEDIEKGVYIIDSVAEKDREIANDDMQRVLKGLPASKNEYEMLRKDGTTFPALIFISPIIYEGKTNGIRGTTVDISKNKETENELRRLSEAVAQSPASIVITDINGNIEYVNKTFEDISGYTYKEVLQENPRMLKSGQIPNEKYKDLWKTISSGKTWRGELLNKKKNGELFWEDAVISPLLDKDGKTVNYLAVKQDITEKKKIMQELINAKEEAEEMNRVKTIFFANMSHELRTPFVGIMGFAELLTETLTDPESKEMAEGILKTSIRMKDTLTKILNLSKLEINEIQTFPKKVSIQNLIDNIYKQFSIAAVKKNLTFHTYVKVAQPIIETDETLLIEILSNLVSNAIIYTNEGGINLTAENQVKDEKELLVIKVKDTGIGIPSEKHDLVWREFRQASEGTTRSYQGTGLGLSISKKYAELIGANIYLESEENKGSTFIVELPIVKYNKPESQSVEKLTFVNKEEPNKESSKKRILYVEDDDTSIAVVTIPLSKHYAIEVAKTADFALAKIKGQKFDAILMDINLGRGMNGEELTQVIRKLTGYEGYSDYSCYCLRK